MGAFSTGARGVRKVVTWSATVAQAGIAFAILWTVGNKLYHFEIDRGGRTITSTCGLDVTPTDEGLCKAAFSAVAITFAVLIALSMVLNTLTFLAQATLCLFWIAFASTLTDAVRSLDEKEPPPAWDTQEMRDARQLVMVLAWAEALMLGILALVTMLTGCCSSDSQDSKRSYDGR